jgi:hypothetical protein
LEYTLNVRREYSEDRGVEAALRSNNCIAYSRKWRVCNPAMQEPREVTAGPVDGNAHGAVDEPGSEK